VPAEYLHRRRSSSLAVARGSLIFYLVLYIYFSILFISFLCSLISFRLHYPRHLKIFSVLLGITVVTEFFANFALKEFWHIKNNMPVYNIYRLFEFMGYAFYFKRIIQSSIVQRIITWFLVFYPLYWFITVFFIFGIKSWTSYLPVGGSPFTILFASVYCYELFVSPQLVDFRRSAELWIALGLIIYYTCDLPYEGMLNFLITNFNSLGEKLSTLLLTLNILMYSAFIYAYLCRINIKKY